MAAAPDHAVEQDKLDTLYAQRERERELGWGALYRFRTLPHEHEKH